MGFYGILLHLACGKRSHITMERSAMAIPPGNFDSAETHHHRLECRVNGILEARQSPHSPPVAFAQLHM